MYEVFDGNLWELTSGKVQLLRDYDEHGFLLVSSW